MQKNTNSNDRKKHKNIIVLCAVVAILIFVFAAAFFTFNHYASKLNIVRGEKGEVSLGQPEPVDSSLSEEAALIDEQLRANLEAGTDWNFDNKNVTNILLIGVDNDYAPGLDQWGNADGLIIVSINKDTKQVVLTSIMRDVYVAVPNAYSTKITLTYHYGGTQTLIETIEANFGIPIDNYILVNYIDVATIVDAVGGLTLELNEDELYYIEDKIRSINNLMGYNSEDNMLSDAKAGPIKLNGVQTAAYMRIRYAGNNDFERTERARRVVLALKDKALGMSLSELNNLANVVLPCITTDLDQGEILSLLLNAAAYMKYDVVSSRLPIDDSFYFSNICGSTIVIDFKTNKEYLYKSVYEGVIG